MKKFVVNGTFFLCIVGIYASEEGNRIMQHAKKNHRRTVSLPGNWSSAPWGRDVVIDQEKREISCKDEVGARGTTVGAEHKKNDDIFDEGDSCDEGLCALLVFAAMRLYETAPCVLGCL